MASRGRGRYSPEEVSVLVGEYMELRELKWKHWILVRLADLEAAVRRLPLPEREAVVLHGLLHLPSREAGRLLGISHTTVRDRYWRGLEHLLTILNGGPSPESEALARDLRRAASAGPEQL